MGQDWGHMFLVKIAPVSLYPPIEDTWADRWGVSDHLGGDWECNLILYWPLSLTAFPLWETLGRSVGCLFIIYAGYERGWGEMEAQRLMKEYPPPLLSPSILFPPPFVLQLVCIKHTIDTRTSGMTLRNVYRAFDISNPRPLSLGNYRSQRAYQIGWVGITGFVLRHNVIPDLRSHFLGGTSRTDALHLDSSL